MESKKERIAKVAFKFGAVVMLCSVFMLFFTILDEAMIGQIRPTYKTVANLLFSRKTIYLSVNFFVIAFILRIPFAIVLEKIDISYIFACLGIILTIISLIVVRFTVSGLIYIIAIAYALYFASYYYKMIELNDDSEETIIWSVTPIFIGLIFSYYFIKAMLKSKNRTSGAVVEVIDRFNMVRFEANIFIIGFLIVLGLFVLAFVVKGLKFPIKKFKWDFKSKIIKQIIYVLLFSILMFGLIWWFFSLFMYEKMGYIIQVMIISFISIFIGEILYAKGGEFFTLVLGNIIVLLLLLWLISVDALAGNLKSIEIIVLSIFMVNLPVIFGMGTKVIKRKSIFLIVIILSLVIPTTIILNIMYRNLFNIYIAQIVCIVMTVLSLVFLYLKKQSK